MKCTIKLHRPYSREPADHKYGEAFDSALDAFVGGSSNWSSSGDVGPGPVAKVSDPDIAVALHETGPEFDFFIVHASEIAAYVGALATLISTWVTVRLAYRKPREPVWEPDGTIIEVGDVKIKVGRDLTPDEVESITSSILSHAKDTSNDA